MTSANTEPTALQAAAERRLADLRAKRIAVAEGKLTAARARLANAQAAEEKAAAACATYEAGANVTALREARDEIAIAEPLVSHHERALAKARERSTTAERDAALALVTAQREAAGFLARVDAIKPRIEASARALIGDIRALLDECSNQHDHRFQEQMASEQLGLPFDERMLVVPDAFSFAAAAILQACRACGFAPHDWATADPRKLNAPTLPLAGVHAVLEPLEEMSKRNEAWQRKLHAEANANSDALAAERATALQ